MNKSKAQDLIAFKQRKGGVQNSECYTTPIRHKRPKDPHLVQTSHQIKVDVIISLPGTIIPLFLLSCPEKNILEPYT